MKKLFSIALSMLLLLSCFAINASAAGVNVFAADKGATYAYMEDMTEFWYSSCKDPDCELLNNGYVPEREEAFETVGVQGTNRVVMVRIDLGAVYTDITAINFLCVNDSYTDQTSGANRSFSGEKSVFKFSVDGDSFKRDKNFTMDRVKLDEDSAESYYNFNFTFNNVSARYIELSFYSPVYVLSLGEIEVISASGKAAAVEEPSSEEESSEEESSEEAPVESEEESEDESVDESAVESEDESVDESAVESEAASTEESKAEESKTESKAESSSDVSTDNNDKDGISPIVIVAIIVAVVAVAAVAIIVIKKKK